MNRKSKLLRFAVFVGMLSTPLGALMAQGNPVPHNQIQPWGTYVSPVVRNVLPRIYFYDGCTPYPAVAPNGDYNNGLHPSGTPGGNCRNMHFAMLYVRHEQMNAQQRQKYYPSTSVIMYAMYAPKDHSYFMIGGHRHEWEYIAVFLDAGNTPVRAGFSAHGGASHVNYSDRNYWQATHPNAIYRNVDPVHNHSFYKRNIYSTPHGVLISTLADWNRLSPTVQSSLNSHWVPGHGPRAVFPMGDTIQGNTFWENIDKAWQ